MHYRKHAAATTRARIVSILILTSIILVSCKSSSADATAFPTYNPFLPVGQSDSGGIPPTLPSSFIPVVTPTRKPAPERAPLLVTLPASPSADQPLVTPTPDLPHQLPTPRQDGLQHVVSAGETLGSIAQAYGISLDTLLQANSIVDPNVLTIGMVLSIPPPEPGAGGPSFKIIPDSELVYGPASAFFDVDEYVSRHDGYLASYTEEVNGEFLTSSEIITLVSQNYSINPRLLIALLEYQSGWLTSREPYSIDFPIGWADAYHVGLYRQLTWAADTLNRGYYLWRANALGTFVLADGSVVPADPTINAGTVALQTLFSRLDDRATWESDISPQGLFLAYFVLFGNPFDLAIEPLIPHSLEQPPMRLPFADGESWSFTGGPHGGWDSGSGWAALDFAPPGEPQGCVLSEAWVRAIADGPILRAKNGAVIQDLDNDGYEQTGWVILYMHIDTNERVSVDDYLFAGDTVGHPSCEGGISTGTHLHIARKYNGEWIPADGSLPFNMDGWVSSGAGIEYDGYLSRDGQIVEAWEGRTEVN
ncbi:MAG: LysM peptidoglycan-binding domain-containing M23 family metallopeptidase, partial [Chloroflexota bacterium]